MNWLNTIHWTTMWRSGGATDESWRWLDRETNDAYVFCFYWTLGVMRTMPAEVQPTNMVERIYIMIFMFFAFSAFAICVGQITQTYFKFFERRRAFLEEFACVRMHMRNIKASKRLQARAKGVLELQYASRHI